MKRIYIILTLVCALFLSGQNIYAQLSERGKLPPVKVENIDAEKVEGTWFLSHFNFYTENPEQDNNFSCIVYRITKDSISTCYHSYRGKDIDKVFFSFIPVFRGSYSRKELRADTPIAYTNNFYDFKSSYRYIRLNDSLLTIADQYDIVTCKDGEYAFRYKKLIPEKKRSDFLFAIKNSTVDVEDRFKCKGGIDMTNSEVKLMPCFPQDSLNRDTIFLQAISNVLSFQERAFCVRFMEWCKDNVKIPEGYSGNIVKGYFHVEFYINMYGYLNTFSIIRGLDEELDSYLTQKIKDFPRILPAKDKNGNNILYKATGRFSKYIPIE